MSNGEYSVYDNPGEKFCSDFSKIFEIFKIAKKHPILAISLVTLILAQACSTQEATKNPIPACTINPSGLPAEAIFTAASRVDVGELPSFTPSISIPEGSITPETPAICHGVINGENTDYLIIQATNPVRFGNDTHSLRQLSDLCYNLPSDVAGLRNAQEQGHCWDGINVPQELHLQDEHGVTQVMTIVSEGDRTIVFEIDKKDVSRIFRNGTDLGSTKHQILEKLGQLLIGNNPNLQFYDAGNLKPIIDRSKKSPFIATPTPIPPTIIPTTIPGEGQTNQLFPDGGTNTIPDSQGVVVESKEIGDYPIPETEQIMVELNIPQDQELEVNHFYAKGDIHAIMAYIQIQLQSLRPENVQEFLAELQSKLNNPLTEWSNDLKQLLGIGNPSEPVGYTINHPGGTIKNYILLSSIKNGNSETIIGLDPNYPQEFIVFSLNKEERGWSRKVAIDSNGNTIEPATNSLDILNHYRYNPLIFGVDQRLTGFHALNRGDIDGFNRFAQSEPEVSKMAEQAYRKNPKVSATVFDSNGMPHHIELITGTYLTDAGSEMDENDGPQQKDGSTTDDTQTSNTYGILKLPFGLASLPEYATHEEKQAFIDALNNIFNNQIPSTILISVNTSNIGVPYGDKIPKDTSLGTIDVVANAFIRSNFPTSVLEQIQDFESEHNSLKIAAALAPKIKKVLNPVSEQIENHWFQAKASRADILASNN